MFIRHENCLIFFGKINRVNKAWKRLKIILKKSTLQRFENGLKIFARNPRLYGMEKLENIWNIFIFPVLRHGKGLKIFGKFLG